MSSQRSLRLRQIIDLWWRHWQIMIFCDNWVLSFHHQVCFLRNIFGRWSDLPFSLKSDCKKEKSVVSFAHEQNSICSQKQMNDIAHEHTIICRQLFSGHVVGSRPMKRMKHLHRMIIVFVFQPFVLHFFTWVSSPQSVSLSGFFNV